MAHKSDYGKMAPKAKAPAKKGGKGGPPPNPPDRPKSARSPRTMAEMERHMKDKQF